jgi:hypothetical protein
VGRLSLSLPFLHLSLLSLPPVGSWKRDDEGAAKSSLLWSTMANRSSQRGERGGRSEIFPAPTVADRRKLARAVPHPWTSEREAAGVNLVI